MIKRLVRDAAFPNIGRLRKGGKRPESGKAPGKDLTYFRFDSDDARATAHFRAAYGDEPAQVNVFLPHQTAAQNFSCWQEAYVSGGLTHRCDGETCVIWLDGTKYRTDPKPCPGGCKEVGRLMVIIPELQRFAYVTVETHSINDIIRLQENLQAVEFLRGDLRGIPFILKRTPVEISTPTADGKRSRREKWLLSIEVDPAWAALQLESMHRAALTAGGVTVDESRMLTTDYVEDEDDDEVVTTVATIPPTVAEWLNASNPAEVAKDWAVKSGACKNEFEAKNSLKKIVDANFDGRLTTQNKTEVLTAFYHHQIEKKQAQPVQAAEPVEAEPVAAF